MNGLGVEWCASADGMQEIVEHLANAARKRGLPFCDAAGRLLVKRAIANARREVGEGHATPAR